MPRTSDRAARALQATVARSLRRSAADMTAFAAEMIRVPTENPPGVRCVECARVIASHLRELALSPRTITPVKGAPSIVATFGAGGRALYFSGHYDVVPAQSREQFSPFVRKGSLHGRGAADMKGGIAAMVYAVHALKAAGFAPRGRIVSVSVPDEETSGPRGTVALGKQGFIEANAVGMLTMEPTSGVVWHANRGVITLRITARGKAAHVGLHFEGINAFLSMLGVANAMARLARAVARRRTSFHITPEEARHSVLLLGGELSGGSNFNVVPHSASFTVDRRTNPEENHARERARLLDVVNAARRNGARVDVEVTQEGFASRTSAKGALARALASAVRQETGETPSFELCPGVLETRHYATRGVPALAYGPGRLDLSHGPVERVSIAKLVECAVVYANVAMKVLG